MTSSNFSSLDDLKKDYQEKATRAKNYKRANFIFDLEDADSYYLKLLISRDEAYAEFKKKELGENEYYSTESARVEHRLQNYHNLLDLKMGGVL